jgi:sodium/hydrogen antiporter
MAEADLLVIAAGVFLYALFSHRGERGSVTGPMVFTVFGLMIGGSVLDLVELPVENAGLDALAEVTLVLALFTDAARIDVRRLTSEHDLPLRMLGLGLPLTMLAGALVAWWLSPGFRSGRSPSSV